MLFAIVGARIFSGEEMLDGHAVLVEEKRIARVVPAGDLPDNVEIHEAAGVLVPGFIDVQVNGGGGVLFNDARSVEGIRAIGAAHRRFGTTGFLPTFISDTRAKMAEAIDAVRAGLEQGIPGLLGIHIEGPFFNPERKGVHSEKYIRQIEEEDIRLITALDRGRTLVTLAPEMVPMEAIARLVDAGVIVSAGHTQASYQTMQDARRQGLSGYTHLFNAMPPLMGREPGPVGAALDDDETWASVIADLHHVSEPALRLVLAAKGVEKVMLITDAMPTVGTDAVRFELQGRTILKSGGRLTTEDGTFAGSDLDMALAFRNMVWRVGAHLPAVLQMASRVPATFLSLDGEYGRIAPGYRASMVLFDDAWKVKRSWIDGEAEDTSG